MRKAKIYISPPHLVGSESKLIEKAMESSGLSPEVEGLFFEEGLENLFEKKKSIAVLNSGTSSIHLALILAGISKADEVICQSFTFSASVNPILYQGAIPVFVDSERETWNMCPVLLEQTIEDRIQKGTKPKAIIVVHSYGMPAKMDAISKIAKKHKIVLIEDAAEALGSLYKNQRCASIGDFGVLSFNKNKIITTFGGGALVCVDKEIKNKAIFLATQARETAIHYEHSEIGYNYKMSPVAAGIGSAQLKVLTTRVYSRRANYDFYKKELEQITEIHFLEEPDNVFSNRWLSCILTSSFEQKEKIRLALEKETIEARPFWKPMHQQPVFERYPSYRNGVSDMLFEKGICLPSGSSLSVDDLVRVVTVIKKCFNGL
jgi:dTDP-4-amino-4,6-dideoxygalactose transaminase